MTEKYRSDHPLRGRRPLYIGLFGNTVWHAALWLSQLEHHNREKSFVKTAFTWILRDGTTFRICSLDDVCGEQFDQVILAPGAATPDAPTIRDVLEKCLRNSPVPPEFRVQYIGEWDEYR